MSEWFFIRQKEGKMMEFLRENRKILVTWKVPYMPEDYNEK